MPLLRTSYASPGATGGQDIEGGSSRAGHITVFRHHDQQGAEAAAGRSQEPSACGSVQQVSAAGKGSLAANTGAYDQADCSPTVACGC